ncbi:hypothetical protein NEUTE1DRAFT_116116 [Neurospora tetrasperma FGSC 2508]|uniref:Uncharacterized protein n=1 Tax=Neurospora tetrasperma (strain FGSC 2508 / ATCC MYA-4615 / P0657) TaxID=510951 RepID=F8MDI1_NEUT8|nr:uncharacterized protein NEUTE1DRAFT_116116 [Neurospora tetrasperma FGSC 2508]EGO61472.1 hypothetical protein NEUTE1DRAFT_116116 [Neurospora tetrasperma FGSC 2508]EGZ69882.1 hypothetical protein NEUTE2DRAFT_146066 [Neurospora tetrasperma FGSC 2509]
MGSESWKRDWSSDSALVRDRHWNSASRVCYDASTTRLQQNAGRSTSRRIWLQ